MPVHNFLLHTLALQIIKKGKRPFFPKKQSRFSMMVYPMQPLSRKTALLAQTCASTKSNIQSFKPNFRISITYYWQNVQHCTPNKTMADLDETDYFLSEVCEERKKLASVPVQKSGKQPSGEVAKGTVRGKLLEKQRVGSSSGDSPGAQQPSVLMRTYACA